MMSPFAHILPMTGRDAGQNEAASKDISVAPTDVPGLFEKFMAQALSPGPGENPAAANPSQPTPVPIQPITVANEYPDKAPKNVASQVHLKGDLKPIEAAGKNPTTLPLNSVQVGSQTLNKVTAKIASDSKSQKNSQLQEEAAAPAPISTEITVNPMLAAVVSMMSPVPPRLEAVPIAPVPSQTEAVAKPAGVGPELPQAKQAAVTKIAVSDFSQEKVAPAAQPMVAAKANLTEAKETGLPAKNSIVSPVIDTAKATVSKTISAALSESSPSEMVDSKAGPPTQPPPDSTGTSIANQDMPMKQAEKATKIAGQTEKVLPGNAVSVTRTGAASSYLPHGEQLTAAAASAGAGSGNVEKDAAVAVESAGAPAVTGLRGGAVERVQEMVTLNAVRLSDSGNSSMQVVIKPDAGTQLSLELRQQGGSVQVQAVLQQGDFSHLSQQWPDLQQRLDQRGIHLAPLNDEGKAAANNNNSGQGTSQQRQNETTEMVPEMTLVETPATMVATGAASAPVRQNWETWA